MTKTTQPRSWGVISNRGEDLNIKKPEAEDNFSLMLSIYDSLNNLYEKLNRLDYLMKRKTMELSINGKNKGETE